jgi:TonB-linked SusC/RagA family outer membrane protein
MPIPAFGKVVTTLTAVALLASHAILARGQQATITGRVTSQLSNEPLVDARVIVVGTSLFTSTSLDGRYTIRNVPSGSLEVRVLRVGFQELKKPVTVVPGQTATLDFAMADVVVQLGELVTTATGEQRRVELGNSVSTVNAGALPTTAPIATVADLITARTPGVQVLPGNMTGTGARVRIRGTSSLSLSNDPIYVIDGVRMTSNTNSSSVDVGGSFPSRVNDLSPEEIDNIEIVKGPSAATLYGTDAANGVIVITTKRGRSGAPHWNLFTEQGAVTDRNTYPTAYTLWGHTPANPTRAAQCSLGSVASGACIKDSLQSFNLFKDANTTPIGTGYRQQYGANLSGGTEIIRYFTSAEWENETGVLKIPRFDVSRLNAQGVDILGEWMHPNALQKTSVRANLNATVSPTLDLALSTGYIKHDQRLPQADNNTTGIWSSAYGGPGTPNNGKTSLGFPKMGYRVFTPGDIFQETVTQGINRFIASANANWRPTSWMQNRANIGTDITDRVDTDLCRFDNCSDFGSNRLGFAVDNRTNLRNFTVDLGSTSSFNPRTWLNSKTTLGVQYVNYRFDENEAASSQLPPGAQTVTAGAVPFAAEQTNLSKTLGLFVEEAAAIRDRLFLTAAVRTDQNSAFGTNFQRVYYPKASLSYVISDEDYFPKFSWLGQLRLRAAYGASGTQPGPTDALRFFLASTANVDRTDSPSILTNALGNAALKPERATEFESGFDSRFFGSRVDLEVTYYNKLTKDALINHVLAPSTGAGVDSRLENLGSVKNAGWEGLVSAQLLDRRSLGIDITLNASTNTNKLVTLGSGIPNIVGSLIQQRAGYPLNGWWQRKYTYQDKNGDGLIRYSTDPAVSEVVVADSATFLGSSIPKYEAGLTTGFDFFNKQLRLTSLIDYKGGFLGDNDTERIRCQNRNNCRGLSDPSAPLWQKARVVALRDTPARTQAGFIEDASFLRFRELALTYTMPSSFARRFLRGQSSTLTLAGRNLGKITNYSGIDPESNYGQNDVQNDFQTAPPATYFILRLNIGF